MKSWKEQFNETININAMLFQYEQQIEIMKKVSADLELKNKKLHECCMTAHNMITEFLNMDRAYFTHDVEGFFGKIEAIKHKMEEILAPPADEAPSKIIGIADEATILSASEEKLV